MATNVLGYYNPAFYANEALIYLQKSLGLASRVYMGYDAERRTFGKGDTINIRRPSTFTAVSAPAAAANTETTSVSITMDQWYEVRIQLTDKELAYTGDRIVSEHIAPAAYALADNIDQALIGIVPYVPWYKSSDSTGVTDVDEIVSTRAILFDNKVPLQDQSNMFFMVGGAEEADLLALSDFAQYQGAGTAGVTTQLTGSLGRRYGFEFFANQNRGTSTFNNTNATKTFAVVGNHAKGATTLSIDGLTAASEYMDKGAVLEITSGTRSGDKYAITTTTTATTNAVVVSISPPLRGAIANDVTGTIGSVFDAVTCSENLAFHRNWAALAMAKLPDYGQFQSSLGLQVASVQDPVTGLSVRSRLQYLPASSAMEVVLDVLYGVKVLDADLACRYFATHA